VPSAAAEPAKAKSQSSAAAPRAPQAVVLNWEQFQEEVGHLFPNIAPFLEMGRLVSIEGNLVTIGFAKQATVARGMLEKADNIHALASLCERLSSQPVRLRIVELTEADPPGPTMAQVRAAKEQEKKMVLFEQAKAHPMVKQALEIFGAELADVRTISNHKEVQE
jgi:DNA polymerase-3 subunit gamma/tau